MGSLLYSCSPGPTVRKGTLGEYLFGHTCQHQVYSRPRYHCSAGKQCNRKTKCPKAKKCFKPHEVVE